VTLQHKFWQSELQPTEGRVCLNGYGYLGDFPSGGTSASQKTLFLLSFCLALSKCACSKPL